MNEDKFDYTYSAPTEKQRREIESIKKQYISAPKSDDKLARLRALNAKVTLPPKIIAYTIGVAGTLVFGLGMTMALVWEMFTGGAITGLVGIAVAVLAYPVYKAVLKRNKQKYGQKIIELSDELLNDGDKNI